MVGALVVSFFAMARVVLSPKRFAGLFGVAPSVAFATLALTIAADGKAYAALEGRSMFVGACAYFVYVFGCMRVMTKQTVRATRLPLCCWPSCAPFIVVND
jgi:hypothetical protein